MNVKCILLGHSWAIITSTLKADSRIGGVPSETWEERCAVCGETRAVALTIAGLVELKKDPNK